ncbi:hypothetical protein DB346_06535 [Verrucomicrobia bacterium LW23]|nr:hypothetical protein DB346_06535 [Verrucomicrobia bacterium LW23]
MRPFLHHYHSPDGSHSVTVADNGRVAYAYLYAGDEVINSVWLYNRLPAPDVGEWQGDASVPGYKAPFLNAAAYVDAERMAEPLKEEGDMETVWEHRSSGAVHMVHLIVRGTHYGVLSPAMEPGWTVAAAKDGPLARRLA